MTGKVGIKLFFPGDALPTDVTSLIRAGSVSFSERLFNEEKRSVQDTVSFSLKHDQNIVDKVRAATSRILVYVTDLITTNALFTGALDPSVSQSTAQVAESLVFEAVDSTWKLDIPIATSFALPAAIGGTAYKVCDPADTTNSLFHQICYMAGYAVGDVVPTITESSTVQHCAAEAGSETYREFLDSLLFEYRLVLDDDAQGRLLVRRWTRIADTYEDTVQSGELSTVVPFTWSRRYNTDDGAKVEWALLEETSGALLYRDSLPVSADGVFTGKNIAAGDYYPTDSDIEDVYQDYVDNWLDKPYLQRLTRIKNKDLSLVAADNAYVDFTADAGVSIDLQTYEPHRAKVRFRNTTGATAKIYTFDIRGKALYRKSVQRVIAPSTASKPKVYTSRFLFNLTAANALATALGLDVVYGDFEYTFGLNRYIQPGTVIRLISAKNDIDTIAIIQECAYQSDRPVYTYVAVGLAEWSASVTLQNEGSSGAAVWPFMQTLDAKNNLSKRIIVNLYQELAITPELPSADITVDLLNNTYTNLTNNWSPTQPQTVRKPIWMINYSTIIPVTQNEITIATGSWPSPIKIFIGMPMYLGMTATAPDVNSFPDKIEGDWCFYSADGKFYKWTGSAWAIDTVTTNEKMAALQDMLTIADSSGATAFVQTLASVNAFIDMLAANEILVQKLVTNSAFVQTLEAINVKINGTLKSGPSAANDAKVALQDAMGVISKTFTGTGTNDLQVTEEGTTAGNADVQIIDAQVNDTTPSGGKIIVAGSTNTEAAPSSTADTDWQTAVNNASGASYNGVTGWKMPTRTELQTMRTVLGLSSGLYWSGDSVDADNAYAVDMSDGSVWTKQKIQTITRTLPTNMLRYTSQLYNGKIYIPSYGGTTMEIYDIATGTTTTVTLPTNMSRITSQLYNGKIYMPQSNGTTMEIYDIATGTTTTKTLPTNAQRATSLLYNGNIYMPLNNSTKMEIFDIATGTTTTITLPTNMYRWTSQLYNGKIYMPQDGGTTMEIYDIATSTTTTVTLPTNMSRITSQLYNGKIYMPQNVGTTMEIFDIATSTTTTVTLPTNMYRRTSQLYNGNIYMPQDGGTTMEIFSIPIPTRYVRNNTETRRCQVRVNGGTWTDKGVIVRDTDIDVGLNIKVRFPSITNHIVGDNWHLVQDSMRGLSIKDKDGVEYLAASDGVVKALYTKNNNGTITQELVKLGAGIIEVGKNTNGNWMKFSDGTMMQFGYKDITWGARAQWNYEYLIDPTIIHTLPTQFTTIFYADVSLFSNYPNSADHFYAAMVAIFNDKIHFRFGRTGDTTYSSGRYYFIAIGRWKQ